jgi:hypothetical protein
MAGGVVQGEGPEFKPQYRKKKNFFLSILGKKTFIFSLKSLVGKVFQKEPDGPYCEASGDDSGILGALDNGKPMAGAVCQ